MLQVTASANPATLPPCTKADDLPIFCMAVVTLLNEQPLFTGASPKNVKPCKVLSLDKWDHIQLCYLVNKYAMAILNTASWNIQEFGFGNMELKDEKEKIIPHGLLLRESGVRCDLETLKKTYEQVLKMIAKGWVSTKPVDHSDILNNKEDPKDFSLYVKVNPQDEEENLIRTIARVLKIENQLKCHAKTLPLHWFWRGMGYKPKVHVYIWARKEALVSLNLVGFNLKLPI